MAKRSKRPTRADRATTTRTSAATTAQALDERVGAFAEQLGRMVGTIQAKAEGWADREVLSKQFTSVRDGATHMLEQLAASVTTVATSKKTTKKGGARARANSASTTASSQAGGKRAAKKTAKTKQRRKQG